MNMNADYKKLERQATAAKVAEIPSFDESARIAYQERLMRPNLPNKPQWRSRPPGNIHILRMSREHIAVVHAMPARGLKFVPMLSIYGVETRLEPQWSLARAKWVAEQALEKACIAETNAMTKGAEAK